MHLFKILIYVYKYFKFSYSNYQLNFIVHTFYLIKNPINIYYNTPIRYNYILELNNLLSIKC